MMVRLPTYIYASLGLSKLSTNPGHIDNNMAMTISMQIPLYLKVLTARTSADAGLITDRVVLDFCLGLIVSFNLVEQITLFE